MPPKSKGKVASPLHSLLLLNLRKAFEARAKELKLESLSIRAGMKIAGASEQIYNQWQNGASPKLITLEHLADKLGLSVHQLLGGQRSIFTTPQSADIASYIDDLPEEAREQIARSVHAQSIAYRTGAVQTRKSGKSQ